MQVKTETPPDPAGDSPGGNAASRRPPENREWTGGRHVATVIADRLPYALSAGLLKQVTNFRVTQNLLLRYYLGLVRRFLQVIETEVDLDLAIKRSLFFGALRHYRIGPWASTPAVAASGRFQAFARKVEMTSTAALKQAVDENRGVILVRDHDNVQSWCYLLSFEGVLPEGIGVHLRRPSETSGPLKNWRFVQQLLSAKKALQHGGVVTIAGDGHHGRSDGIEYHFHGRCRPFRTGFAELALMTGAPVFAPVGSVGPDGIIRFTFVGPFDAGDATMERNDRIRHLVDQFVAHLQQKWAEAPWLVPWFQMEKHLAYPPTSGPRPDRDPG